MRIMSLSWISWKPRMLEPSNPTPSSNISSSISLAEIEKCCHKPGRSTKRRSIILMPSSLTNFKSSLGFMSTPWRNRMELRWLNFRLGECGGVAAEDYATLRRPQ